MSRDGPVFPPGVPWKERFPFPRCLQNGIETSDYKLKFTVPYGTMPDDANFGGQQASLRVHRVSPTYNLPSCKAKMAIVLVHGKTLAGSDSFDLQHTTPTGDSLSLQEALARAGIDTFAPDLLGYGLSTRFANGLDDPNNASRSDDKTRSARVFPLEQQTRYLGDNQPLQVDGLGVNPLGNGPQTHSSSTYFANTDVWARDILQVVDYARQTTGLRVALLGYSFGGPRIGRALYRLGAGASEMISEVIFMSSLFDALPGKPGEPPTPLDIKTEEDQLDPVERSTTFPLTLSSKPGWDNAKAAADGQCAGRVPPGAPEALAAQTQALDPLGATWGGADRNRPTGLIRSPTFTVSGWNKQVAKGVTLPTLVLHGTGDGIVPVENSRHLYAALTTDKKVLVEVRCASHLMQYETATTWPGPHKAVADAIIEWLSTEAYAGESKGRFSIDENGRCQQKPDRITPNPANLPPPVQL